MKKVYLFVFSFICFFLMGSVSANTISSIDMKIAIDENGNANITEVWDVKGTDGTEWYKVMNGLGNSELSNFTVSMDGNPLKYKDWRINESLNDKKGYYGINYTSSGLELCFGKYDYNSHNFILNYNLSNYVFNTSDSQVLYWNLIGPLSNVNFKNFSATVTSYYEFPDTLDVWGYGYKGYAYVKDGKIYMSNEGDMGSNYGVLLVKFPLNTFNTDNSDSRYNTFDEVYKAAEDGTFEYDYSEGDSYSGFIDLIIIVLFYIFVPLIIIFIAGFSGDKYGYKDNKKIDKKNISPFRDIPCNKDIYYANALINLNDFDYKSTNIFGAIILKWIKEGKIRFISETKGVFNKETSKIDLTLKPITFDNEIEEQLFEVMYEASNDGLLEAKEFEKWGKKHYTKFFNIFDKITNSEIERLKKEGHIYKRANKSECKKKNVMDDIIYEDSVKLYGLKKFLDEFTLMKEKTAIEVHLWDEYLMFAYLFGMAGKVSKQFKDLYPEIVQQMENTSFNYSDLMFINYISTSTVSAASSARTAAASYSSGGGGFSSGGGGGGSFGGGGGGSR